MGEYAVLRRDLYDRYAPLMRRRSLQPLARTGAGLLIEYAAQAHRAARFGVEVVVGVVLPDMAIGIGVDGLHLRPVALQFLAYHHRVRSQHTLTQFRLVDANEDTIIGTDDDPRIDFDPALRGRLPRPGVDPTSNDSFRSARVREIDGQRHATADCCGRDQELSAIDFRCHDRCPSAFVN